MSEIQPRRQYDLEARTLAFARGVRQFVARLCKTQANIEDGGQLIRSSGSVGANYIEANEALSKKDFAMRAKICRKEAKESRYWLDIIDTGKDGALETDRKRWRQEADELTKIFGAIVEKTKPS
ncbi:MAG: four helix bundle protein [Planctomycetaceae bacterium]|nr:four helix bundle protein [Planctomycetaceae bacterium]